MTEEFKFDDQTRELISVAASVAANCLPCLRYHFAEAVRLGSPSRRFARPVKSD